MSAFYRIFSRGARRADGTHLPLPSVIGPNGNRVTTKPAIDRWLAELNNTTITTTTTTVKAHAAAERRLAAAGI